MLTAEILRAMAEEVHLDDRISATGFMCLTDALGDYRRKVFKGVLADHRVGTSGSLDYLPAKKSNYLRDPFPDREREEHGMYASNSARVFFLLFLAESGLF